jgi:hypothetical protein
MISQVTGLPQSFGPQGIDMILTPPIGSMSGQWAHPVNSNDKTMRYFIGPPLEASLSNQIVENLKVWVVINEFEDLIYVS